METLTTDISEEVEKQITKAEEAYNQAQALTVTNDKEYDDAGTFIVDLKTYKKNLEKERKDLTSPLDDAKRKIMAKFKPHVDNIERAIAQVNGKMTKYFSEQEKLRLAEQAKAEEKARKERERLQRRAEKAEDKGDLEKAESLRETANNVVSTPVESQKKQTSKTTMVETWKAEVYDKLSLIEAVAKGEQSMELLDVNLPALNQLARAQKDTLKIPGVRSVCEKTVRKL